MPARLSLQRVPGEKKKRKLLPRLILLISTIAILILATGVASFSAANQLMRRPAPQLANISSNIMPVFQLASFPSLDEQTSLSGWFFPARGTAVSTVILVHDQDSNRLPFGLETPFLYEYLTERGFHVLAFDLRNSGRSEGDLAAYGYAEWADVVAAIRYTRRVSSTRDVVLFGIGSGVTASLLALEQLPLPGQDADSLPAPFSSLGFDRSYVRGLILDTPAVSPDSYIRPDCRQQGQLGEWLLQYTVPYAVRLSAGSLGRTSHVAVLSRTSLPVFLAYSETDSWIALEEIQPLIDERLRLHPDTTVIHTTRANGRYASFSQDQDAYLRALDQYFRRYFSRPD